MLTPDEWGELWQQRVKALGRIEFRHGNDIYDEVAACVLLTHGVSPSTALRTWFDLKTLKIWRPEVTLGQLEYNLQFRHRYWKDRAGTIFFAYKLVPTALEVLHQPQAFRRVWLNVDGIGPKTASMITRNYLGCEQVAVIDKLTLQAMHLSGLSTTSNYYANEQVFLGYATDLGVRPSYLDRAMVQEMRLRNNDKTS